MKKMIPFVCFTMILLVVLGSLYWRCYRPNTSKGNIVLRIMSPNSSTKSSLIVMDENGNNIRWLGNYEGSPAWSPDGHNIAVGCKDELCIIDFAGHLDRLSSLINQDQIPSIIQKIHLPSSCKSTINYGAGEPYFGILSISWSPSGDDVVVVCGGETLESAHSVCTISLEGETKCWDQNASQDVYRAVWSPVDENVIAVAGHDYDRETSKIYLVDPTGGNRVYLTYGWSPEWSPTGDEIAFISNNATDHLGLAVINRDGTERHWLKLATPAFFYFDCHGFSGPCRLSWSQDKRYLTFVSSNAPGTYAYRLYRVNIKTGDVIQLVDNMLFQYPAEPDWGP